MILKRLRFGRPKYSFRCIFSPYYTSFICDLKLRAIIHFSSGLLTLSIEYQALKSFLIPWHLSFRMAPSYEVARGCGDAGMLIPHCTFVGSEKMPFDEIGWTIVRRFPKEGREKLSGDS